MRSRAVIVARDDPNKLIESGPWVEHGEEMNVRCPLAAPRQLQDDEILTTETEFDS